MFISLKNKVQNSLGVDFWRFYSVFEGFKNSIKNTAHWPYLDS